MATTEIPELPKLYYSTWGYDFYSEHWMAEKNCWMYSMLKFAEANIDLEQDTRAIPFFDELTGSDYIFMHTDPSQWPAAQEAFLELFSTAMKEIPLRKKEVATVFPIDPFVNYFTYVSMEKPASEPVFTVYKLVEDDMGKSLGELKSVKLEPTLYEYGGLYIYGQRFLLHPESRYMFKVSCLEAPYHFNTPDFGMPMLTTNNMSVNAKYDFPKLNEQLTEIWGLKERIAVHNTDHERSQSLYRKEELEKVLKGKKVAIFKYNKEAYSLLRFNELTCFDTTVVFDDAVELEDASTYIHADKTAIPVINDINQVEIRDFDAVILTCSLNYESEVSFLKRIMDRAMAEKLPVISLYDDALKYADIFDGTEDITHFYKISLDNYAITGDEIAKWMAYKPEKTLGVFGTDTVQGKFTTQIYLREALKKQLPAVGHFATEPTGSLLSADIGFSRMEEDDMQLRFAAHRKLQSQLEQQCDIVITGGQNSMVFAADGASHRANASTLIFNEFQPSYVILTAAVDTPLVTISKSIDYIKELAAEKGIHTQIIAFAIMGGRKLQGSRWTETYFMDVRENKIEEAKNRIYEATNIPIFSVPQEIDQLADAVYRAISQ
jgi:1,4-alpha-glucan branching enzyme